MQIERGVLRLGAEIEVADWKKGSKYQDVAQSLRKQGYMIGTDDTWAKWHTYHCDCVPGGCGLVKSGDIIDPPLVSMTYDATLPEDGAEFIMSPILLADQGMPHFEQIWKTIADKAVWTNKRTDQKGRPCSPSVHLHVSATLKQQRSRDEQFREELLHALSLFSPELFLLADSAQYRRGIAYRLPDRHSMNTLQQGKHHGFVQIRQATRNQFVHVEWRLFEAAYDTWEYVEAAAYLAAGLTRGLLSNDTFSQLMSTGYMNPYNEQKLRRAVANDNTEAVLAEVHPERLQALRQIAIMNLDDDDYAAACVADLFAKVM